MNEEIITVGTELLLGDIVNTNSQFLSRELAAYGIGCLLLEKLGCRKDAHPGSGLLALVAGLDLLAVVFRLGDYAVIHLPAGVLYGAAAVPAV